MAQLVLSAASSAVSAIGSAGIGAAVARTVATTAASFAASSLEGLIFGPQKRSVEGPRLESFTVQASTEGASVLRVFGRARVAGQIIWAANFKETVSETTEQSGGKGGRPAVQTEITEYLYSISIAIGLCEGEISRIARIWADGKPFDLSNINARVYRGTEDQLPDDVIVATETNAPAFRGLAYIVFEDLPLKDFGNRIPQFSFEIEKSLADDDPDALENALTAATFIPGSGEFAYGTTRILRETDEGVTVPENANNNTSNTDFTTALENLSANAPNVSALSLVVSWFGDDLRAGQCTLQPRVDAAEKITTPYEWGVGGISRHEAMLVSEIDSVPAYGGTPSDRSVLEAIAAMKAQNIEVMFHPFILMDVAPGNGLTDPYGGSEQAPFPWRGRITVGANDKTAVAANDIENFFGTAVPSNFTISNGDVIYSGPPEWSFRRMILHYAYLCALAGGVEGFLIGSELRGITTARSNATTFPAIAAMKQLASDVRSILGNATKISYGADWTEYNGHQPADGTGDVFFHLDDFWSDTAVDFIGIDNYAPLSDWRDGFDHLDLNEGTASIYDLDYLKGRIESGEAYDWFYLDQSARDDQIRSSITDGAYNEPWIYRAKDVRSFWFNTHHNRPDGLREEAATSWVPQSKPVRFTELGFPAVDKGANQPNVFVDPKSAESALPHYSAGARDDLIQRRGLEAVLSYWRSADINPVSSVYNGPMIEIDRSYVYAVDARPFPYFPGRSDVWGDAGNWEKGHWLNGRLGRAPLDRLVEALAAEGGVSFVKTDALKGVLSGYVIDRPMSPRDMIDPLADLYQFDMIEEGDDIVFTPRDGATQTFLNEEVLVDDGDAPFKITIGQESDLPTAFRLGYLDEGADYGAAVAEARQPGGDHVLEAGIEVPAVIGEAEAEARARAILADAHVMREAISFVLPPTFTRLVPGDAVKFSANGFERDYRITEITDTIERRIEAVRVSAAVYDTPIGALSFNIPESVPAFGAPIWALFDLPLLRENDDPAAPWFAAYADPWPGGAVLYRESGTDILSATAPARAIMGRLTEALPSSPSGRWINQSMGIRLSFGTLASRSEEEIFNGANVLAVEASNGVFEVLQFADADLEGDGIWRLSRLLRGQAGSENEAALGADEGARVILFSPALVQANVGVDLAGLEFSWRAGPVGALPSEESFSERQITTTARGLAPLSPVYLTAKTSSTGIELSWIRRTRIGGDRWQVDEVPLGEVSERYRIEIIASGEVVRMEEVTMPAWQYTQSAIDNDFPAGLPAGTSAQVAQISDEVGVGRWAEIPIA